MPDAADFRTELQAQIARAERQRRPHIEVNAGELHRTVGGYPPKSGVSHWMPSCCKVMRDEFDSSRDEIVHQTESGTAPSLTIRYRLPR